MRIDTNQTQQTSPTDSVFVFAMPCLLQITLQ